MLQQGDDGTPVVEICRKAGINQPTCFNWKKRYAGVRPAAMKRLRELEQKKARFKKIAADLPLDRELLKDVINREM